MNLLIAKVTNNNGVAYMFRVLAGVEWCAEQGANVINLGIGGPTYNQYHSDIFKRIYEEDGVLIVAPAGASGTGAHSYPASYESVVSVGAVNKLKNIASFSNTNDQIEMVGPGVSVYSTVPGNAYSYKTGTNIAATHVTGVAALVWSHFPSLNAALIRDVLQKSAEDLGGQEGKDPTYGYGLVRAKEAFDLLNSTDGYSLSPSVSPSEWPTSSPSESYYDDYFSEWPTISPTECSGVVLAVNLTTDNFGSETSWNLTIDDEEETILTGKDYIGNQEYYASACVEACDYTDFDLYTFSIFDTYGDGLGNGFNAGAYLVTMDGVMKAEGGGNFGYEETKQFSVCEFPSDQPSRSPSDGPTMIPSELPSISPSGQPSMIPSDQPSRVPSDKPSRTPSDNPSFIPSDQPSRSPSEGPTMIPSEFPTITLSGHPSMVPSDQPSKVPSSDKPSRTPSDNPFFIPSDQPSRSPTAVPTNIPSELPSISPSGQPSMIPSNQPSRIPSDIPSRTPSDNPSFIPSDQPSRSPTEGPTMIPSEILSVSPSGQPSVITSDQPSRIPSDIPSRTPSDNPSFIPSDQPSRSPSEEPTMIPSEFPSVSPSDQPSVIPSDQPSKVPSDKPSRTPSDNPSFIPSDQPSRSPSEGPTMIPSEFKPSLQPSNLSDKPSSAPIIFRSAFDGELCQFDIECKVGTCVNSVCESGVS